MLKCALLSRGVYAIAFVALSVCANANASGGTYEVTDSFGKHYIEQPPQRVVVTDWALLEQMLELGVEPIGAPELKLYRRYVRQPALPESIVDIGLRRSPDLQTLRELKPDVIIVGTDQKGLARPFSYIAPVMYYKSFSDKYRTNGTKSRERFLQIADLFRKRDYAESKLAQMDAEMSEIRKRIQARFKGQPPDVTIVRFSSEEKILVYGANSLPVHVLEQLGLRSGMSVSRSKWGYRELPVSRLGDIDKGLVFYVEPLDVNDNFFDSNDWKNIPAVSENRVLPMRAVWSYGGAMSLLYNARAIEAALTLSTR
ncbi:MAG: iron-siderophore ABC transporter substrate-binding protein [Pseudomonadota bacterium]